VPGDPSRSARARYLRIATDLAGRQQGGRREIPYLAARVQLADVAAALGRARTALYRQWETQHDFWVDLTLYLAYEDDLTQRADNMPWNTAARALEGLRVEGDDSIELVRAFGNAGHAELDANPWLLVRAGLLGYPDVPGLADLRRQLEQRRIELLADFAGAVLAAIARTPAHGFSSADLATILWCAADAHRVRRHFVTDREELWWLRLDEGGGPADWTLWAFLSRAVLFDLSEPAASESPSPPAARSAMAPTTDPFDRWNDLQRQALAVATRLLLADLLPAERQPSPPVEPASRPADRPWADERSRDLAVLGHVTIARVAGAAGVSRRAVYDVWPTRTDMILDVLAQEVAVRRATLLHALRRAIKGHTDGADIAAITDAMVTGGPGERQRAADIVLAFIPAAADPRVQAIIGAGHDRYLAEVGTEVERLIHAAGRRLRSDVRLEQLAVLWLSIIEGGRRLRRTNPAALRPATAERPSALGAAARAVLEHATVAR
jgi:AcrR family transcriptional regulator